jgi:fucose permease
MLTQSPARIDYRVVVIAYLTFVALGLPGGLLGVAWPSIRDTFGVTAADFGTLLFAGTAGYLIAGLFTGRIVSRLGIGPALLLASAISAVGLAGFAVAPGWWFLIFVGVILGLGQGIVDAGVNLHFASNYTPRLMNWLHASFGLGAAFGPLLMTGLFALDQDWHVGYIVMAVVQVALILIFMTTLNRWQVQISPDSGNTNPAAPAIIESLRQPHVLLSIALFFVFTGMESTAGNWSYTVLTESRAVDIITAGQWVSLYWWSFTLGRLLFGFIADRVSVTSAIRACFLLVLAGAMLFTANISNLTSFAGLAIIGFALAPIFPLLTTNTPQRLGSDHATNAIGFQVGAASLGIAGLPALAGYLVTGAGLEVVGPFMIGAAFISLTLFQFAKKSQ